MLRHFLNQESEISYKRLLSVESTTSVAATAAFVSMRVIIVIIVESSLSEVYPAAVPGKLLY